MARRILALAVFVAGVLSLLIPVDRLGEKPRYSLSEAEVRAAADRFLVEQQARPGDFRAVAWPAVRWGDDDSLAGKYFLERRPVKWVEELFEKNRPIPHWGLRYFKELDQEEWRVSVDPASGRVNGFSHMLPEDRPGADIAASQALSIATAFAQAHGRDVGAMDLKEQSSEKKKARRDHTLEWEARAGDRRNLDEAHFRVAAEVDGDRVVALRTYWKIPEAYQRARSQQNAVSIPVTLAKLAMWSLLSVGGILLLVQHTRKGQVRWTLAVRLAIPFTVLSTLTAALGYPQMWRNYMTSIPMGIFQATLMTSLVIGMVFVMMLLCALIALMQAVYPESFAAFGKAARRVFGVDAALAMLVAVGLAVAVSQLRGLLMAYFHAWSVPDIGAPEIIASMAPALGAIGTAARAALMMLGALAVVAATLDSIREWWLWVAGAVLALAAMAPSDARTPAELALGCAMGLLPLAAGAIFCWCFARRNWLAYVLAAWVLAMRGPILQLTGEPNRALQLQGWVLDAVLVATLLVLLAPALRRAD
jgi:hypothetical protein